MLNLQSKLNNAIMEMQTSNQNKPTLVISWIGFGLAITVFLLIWFVNILVFMRIFESTDLLAALYILLIFVGGILGIMALIFSIVGLSIAIKKNSPRWIGTSGIIICVLSIISFFIPMICAVMMPKEPSRIETPESIYESEDNINEDVTIQIFSVGQVRCINNKSSNSVIGNMDTFDYDFEGQLTNWLEINKVDSSTSIAINSSRDAEYSDVSKVLDTLMKNGISKFKMSSSLTTADYYR